ncbi:betaine/proline/choline family ABC transporter ATP-binding protein [Anaerotignum sp. MB30-C6]|uniref:betaine/proline/choline family ABC transporter ATP-binding protein n=1 Tax=Anaerotignum sp. MB30-C6 TaxID=3070814 RepID=UPI0027DE9433|nr:ABC transporter ATP-binding protein [Anaerotignum sp. MB30-C6]WMI81882.1 ABC transporter ATP-binding protein [Anaerotignum sp. MB30-C6]
MVRFDKVTKNFKTQKVLKSVSFEIPKGQLVAIIGESGCGKTTLLKMINRLIKPSSGAIYIENENIQNINEVDLRRNIGYVIQQTGLFPHMTIRENIELIPTLEKIDGKKIGENTKRLMEMVGLDCETFLDRYPTELSGGQQQRVGVARAFATDPDIILMDEPFSALDPITRSDLQDELVQLQMKVKKTIIFVTHDMEEAIKIADRICIMRNGEVLQYDTPENILKNPIDEFVSSFVGKNRIWSSPEYIKVSDIMIENPITTSKDMPVLKCMERMRQKKVDSLLVVNKETGHFLGMVKASRLRGVEDKTQTAEAFMTTKYPTLSPDQNILDALKTVTERGLSTVPVLFENEKLAGLITRSSLVTSLSQQYFDCEEEGEEE